MKEKAKAGKGVEKGEGCGLETKLLALAAGGGLDLGETQRKHQKLGCLGVAGRTSPEVDIANIGYHAQPDVVGGGRACGGLSQLLLNAWEDRLV